MHKRTVLNSAVIATALLTITGVGVAIANAATSDTEPTADPSSSVTAAPSATATATASAGPSAGSSSDGSTCEEVFLAESPSGDSVGELCTVVDADGTAVNSVKITFTASASCSGSLMLRVSGANAKGAEFGNVKEVTCNSGTASASFTPASEVLADTFICGSLLSDEYTTAQACVVVS